MHRRLERRIGILFAVSLLLLIGLFVRAFHLQALQGESLASQAASQQEDIIEVPGLRGSILDRNGLEPGDTSDIEKYPRLFWICGQKLFEIRMGF